MPLQIAPPVIFIRFRCAVFRSSLQVCDSLSLAEHPSAANVREGRPKSQQQPEPRLRYFSDRILDAWRLGVSVANKEHADDFLGVIAAPLPRQLSANLSGNAWR